MIENEDCAALVGAVVARAGLRLLRVGEGAQRTQARIAELQRLQSRSCEDKLRGTITETKWREHHERWQTEIDEQVSQQGSAPATSLSPHPDAVRTRANRTRPIRYAKHHATSPTPRRPRFERHRNGQKSTGVRGFALRRTPSGSGTKRLAGDSRRPTAASILANPLTKSIFHSLPSRNSQFSIRPPGRNSP